MPSFIHGHRRGRRSNTNRYTPTYNSWRAMKARCDNPHNERYSSYGGRGICYDPRWTTFEAFLDDMGERPKGKTLGRRDADLGYNVDNCRWEWSADNSGGRRTGKKNKK